jgi:uncharacterized repeat protein (TIGR01451 family)
VTPGTPVQGTDARENAAPARRPRRRAGLVLALAVLAALLPVLWTPAAATHVEPVFIGANDNCAELGDSEFELRVQPVADGTYGDGTLSVTIDVRDTSAGQVFDFTSNIPVDSVFVKGGPVGNFYDYDPSASADTGLHAPVNPNNGLYYGLSHISFCYSRVPSTDVTVSANPTVIHSGDSVTFTITEENDGVLPLTGATVVTDSVACNTALAGPTGDDGDGVLEPGETWTWTCTIPVTGDPDLDYTLTVTGHGDTPDGDDVTWCSNPASPPADTFCDQDERDDVDIDIINPSTDVDVSASPTVIKSGDSVTFTFTEENDGDVDLTAPSIVTSSTACNTALSGPTGDGGDIGVLDTGETWTWTCTIPVTGDPDLDFNLVVTGHGTDPTGDDVTWCENVGSPPANTFCDQDERASVTVDIINPSTDVDVSASATTVEPGASVTFTFTEENDGDADLTAVSVDTDNDACDAAKLGPTGDDGDNVLETGETWSWTCTIPVPGASGTSFTLTVTGHGTDPTGDDVTWCADVANPPASTFCDQDERDSVTVDIRDLGEGLTPGYWKNHLESWVGYSPNQSLESVFDVPDSLGLDDATLLDALSFKGGGGTKGAAQTLLRAAVAALLNSAHPNIDYPRSTADVIADVNAALASGSRSAMLALAAELDADNNLGGDINS